MSFSREIELEQIDSRYSDALSAFFSQLNQVVVGKEHEMQLAFACLLADGHLLIEDIPGVGKTTTVKALAKLLGLGWNRIQFTNDLLPADIIGSNIYDQSSRQFEFVRGPLFSELVIADELNRATPKTQSACLQAMAESAITVEGKTYDLSQPFFVIATQNPQDNFGTFPLPESQIDRFLMRLSLGYPARQEEKKLLLGHNPQKMMDDLKPVMTKDTLIAMKQAIRDVHVENRVADYILDLTAQTRKNGAGLSTRAALGLLHGAQAWAFCSGRTYVIPEDVKSVVPACMNHRLLADEVPNSERVQEMIGEIIAAVKAP